MNEHDTEKITLNVLTMSEAAELLQVSKQTIVRMIYSKELPGGFKVGGQWRFNQGELLKWIQGRSPEVKDGAMRDL